MTEDDARELGALLPDPARHGLPAHRHDRIREQLMSQISHDRTVTPPVRRRPLYALAGVFLAVIVVLGATAVLSGGFRGGSQDPAGLPESVPAPVPPSPTVTITHGPRHGEGLDQPPPFRVRYGDTELVLNPHTYCYASGCADGFDPDPFSIGSPEVLYVFVPVPSFTNLYVNQVEGEICVGRSVDAAVTPLGDGWWSVHPRGPAGDYRVSIFAQGGGDMVADLRWQTPSDQPLPDPTAWLALIADHDGRPDSYGLELAVSDLGASPQESSARITVTAGNGESMSLDATRSADVCQGEGTVYFDGPDDEALRASQLGDFPFTLRVELVLDGVTHVAIATYPDDEIEGNEPSVALHFAPPLA